MHQFDRNCGGLAYWMRQASVGWDVMGVAVGSRVRRAAAVAGAAAVLLGLVAGVASPAGAVAGTRLVTGQDGSGGTWGKAIEVPGSAALNRYGEAHITSVSCGAAGNCTAGGNYLDGSDMVQAFVASQAHGTWRKAIEVPGTAALNTGGLASIDSVSCASAGNCTAGGDYLDRSLHKQAFVDSEVNGTWGTAIEVHG